MIAAEYTYEKEFSRDSEQKTRCSRAGANRCQTDPDSRISHVLERSHLRACAHLPQGRRCGAREQPARRKPGPTNYLAHGYVITLENVTLEAFANDSFASTGEYARHKRLRAGEIIAIQRQSVRKSTCTCARGVRSVGLTKLGRNSRVFVGLLVGA